MTKKSMYSINDDGGMHSILLLWSAGPIIVYTAYESH